MPLRHAGDRGPTGPNVTWSQRQPSMTRGLFTGRGPWSRTTSRPLLNPARSIRRPRNVQRARRRQLAGRSGRDRRLHRLRRAVVHRALRQGLRASLGRQDARAAGHVADLHRRTGRVRAGGGHHQRCPDRGAEHRRRRRRAALRRDRGCGLPVRQHGQHRDQPEHARPLFCGLISGSYNVIASLLIALVLVAMG